MPAASVTSMGSSPRAPQASANSLARASDTARKMFSYSFVASAASAELTRYTTSVSWLMTQAARSAHVLVAPPTTRGVFRCR